MDGIMNEHVSNGLTIKPAKYKCPKCQLTITAVIGFELWDDAVPLRSTKYCLYCLDDLLQKHIGMAVLVDQPINTERGG